jgi:beta-lactamase regulating signal transducer with metallopeptidase domain
MNGAVAALNLWAGEWLRLLGKASWEGALSLLVAALFCALLPRITGNLRCWVWRLAFLKLLFVLLLWRPIELPLLKSPRPVVTASVADAPVERSTPREFRPRPLPELPARLPGRSSTLGVAASQATAATRLDASAWWLFAWTLGVCLRVGHLLIQGRSIRRWRRECVVSDDPRLTGLVDQLRRHLRMRRSPAILIHASYGPLLLDGLAPAIILPSALLRSAGDAELRMVLAHELAHLKRRDYFWNSAVALVQTLFFFHPLAWLAGRQHRLTQEVACDEMTLRATGASVRDYAELLLNVASGHCAKKWSPGALGVLGSGIAFERRLSMLQQLGTRSRAQTMGAGVAATVVALCGLAPWRVVAQPASPGAAKSIPSSTAGKAGPNTVEPMAGAVAALKSAPTPGEASSVAWEDVLLLQATRYLRLSSSQLQQLLPVARSANRKLTDLQQREDKTLETLRRIALRQREALVEGREASVQEQADAISLRDTAHRLRGETESAIVRGSLAELVRVLTPKQVERAYLLMHGQTPEGEVRTPALLDPVAGFVTAQFGGPPMFGARRAGGVPANVGAAGGQPDLVQQLMFAQAELAMLQQRLTDPFPPGGPGGGNRGVVVGRAGGGEPPMVFHFGDGPPPAGNLPPRAKVLDAAGFRQHLADRAQALSGQVQDLRRRVFSPDGAVPPEQYEALLQPLARRLFLSTRLQEALENRLKVKS